MLKVNAMANKATGKGFENESYYANMRFYSFAIENIHVMRASLQKLIDGLFSFSFFFKKRKNLFLSRVAEEHSGRISRRGRFFFLVETRSDGSRSRELSRR